jgi:hypothetical protein
LAHGRDGLREKGCLLVRLPNAFCDFVFARVGRDWVFALPQEGRLGGCESMRCIAANISRVELAAHRGERDSCFAVCTIAAIRFANLPRNSIVAAARGEVI